MYRLREKIKLGEYSPAPLYFALVIFGEHCDCKDADNTESEPKRYKYDPPAPVDDSNELQDNQNNLDDIQQAKAGCLHCIPLMPTRDYFPL